MSEYVVHEKDTPVQQLTRRVVRPLVTEAIGARSLAMYSGVYEAGRCMPIHKHDEAEEVLYVLSGRGWIQIEDERTAIEEGSAIYVAPGLTHYLRVASEEPLHLLFVYAPPVAPGSAPEQDVLDDYLNERDIQASG